MTGQRRTVRRAGYIVLLSGAALAALTALGAVSSVIERGRSAEELLVQLDRIVADVPSDLLVRAGTSAVAQASPSRVAVGRLLDALDRLHAAPGPLTMATLPRALDGRLGALLMADLTVEPIAIAYLAYVTEASLGNDPTPSGITEAGASLDQRFAALHGAISAYRAAWWRKTAHLTSVLDLTARLLVVAGAAAGLWFARRRLVAPDDRAATGRALPRVSEPVAWIDTQGSIRQVEGAVDRVLGCPGDALIGKNIAALVRADDVALVERFLAQCSKDAKTVAAVEFRPKQLDGVWLSMAAVGGRRQGDSLGRESVVKLVDVTSRRRAEEALQASTEVVKTLVDASPLAIVIEDGKGRVRLWNAAAERLFGWTSDEVLGHENPTVPAQAAEEQQNLRKRVHDGHSFTGLESQRVRRDGTLIDASITTAPLKHQDRRGTDAMEVISDITDRKLLEAQLRQAQKMEAVGRLAGGIAHDFNNLLTAIVGHADMLLKLPALAETTEAEQPTGSAIRFGIDQIQRAGARAAALTQQLLAFSRAQVLQPAILNLNAAVADMEPMLQRLIGEDIDLKFVPGAGLESVKADPTQIAQVVMNLALNARDAMPAGGNLTIETSNVELDEAYVIKHVPVIPGPYVMLAVSDTGSGMNKETQARIFEPFFTTKEKGQGTGLGLATVYGIIRQSGGNIWVYSEPGHGTSFKVYLPSVERRAGTREVVARPAPPPLRGSETVLLVEDEEMVRALVRQVLTWHGYNVIEAHNGEEALKVAATHPGKIHLMLTDIVMPGMSAVDLTKKLSAMHPDTRILYMSGYTDHAIVRNNLLSANRAFLQKPFAPDRLAHKVREILSQPHEAEPPTGQARPLNDLLRELPLVG